MSVFLRHRVGIKNLQIPLRTNSVPFSCIRRQSVKINTSIPKNFLLKRTASTFDFRNTSVEERLEYAPEKSVPLAVNDFKQIMFKKLFYADKSMFIKEYFDSNDKVSLFLRPHRFGRTTMMSFLRDFCNKETAKDTAHYFKSLEVYYENGGHYWNSFAGAFPVVHLSFDNCIANDWEEMKKEINQAISSGLSRHKYLATSFFVLTSNEKKELKNLLSPNTTVNSLHPLTSSLQKYWKAPCLVIIEDYDTPLLRGIQNGFGEKVSQYLSPIVTSLLKDNDSVYRGVLIGATPFQGSFLKDIPDVSIYSLLNSRKFIDKFGFTKEDVDDFMARNSTNFLKERTFESCGNYKTLSDELNLVNMTSVLSVGALRYVGSFWVPSQASSWITTLLKSSSAKTKMLLKDLISGKSIETKLSPVDLQAAPNDEKNLLPLLYFHGYLTAKVKGQADSSLQGVPVTLQVPNKEVILEFGLMVRSWFQAGSLHLQNAINALAKQDFETASQSFKDAASDIHKSKEISGDLLNFHQTFGLGVWAWSHAPLKTVTIADSKEGHILVSVLPHSRATAILYTQLSPSSIQVDAATTQLRATNPTAYEQVVRSKLKEALEISASSFDVADRKVTSETCEIAVICYTAVYEDIAEMVTQKLDFGPRKRTPKPNLRSRPITTLHNELV